MKIALVALVLLGCAAPQHPFHFTLPNDKQDPIDAVVRALVSEGLTAGPIDRNVGVVQTLWQDTGFGYGFVQVNGASPGATIVRRYTVIVARSAAGSDITLRADTQKCAAGTFDLTTNTGVGCQPLDGLVPPHQEALDRLGARLRAALHG